ncbi:unnamed protein product [Soboliphyme baturini]|uniref:Homeobox domain-containing protein n=1 Tax=Soboliphyme baturini TaxID=241478 RepID=A0A183J445_9BILA|nr:unnamed protein product [Soboliphyme baturini]
MINSTAYYSSSSVVPPSLMNAGNGMTFSSMDEKNFLNFPAGCLPLSAIPPSVHPSVGALEEQRVDISRYTHMVANRNLISASQLHNYFYAHPGSHPAHPAGNVVISQPSHNPFWWNYGSQDSGQQQLVSSEARAVALKSAALNQWQTPQYPTSRYAAVSPATSSCNPESTVQAAEDFQRQRSDQPTDVVSTGNAETTTRRKKGGNRKMYSEEQKAELEKEFSFNNYISSRRRLEIAEMTGNGKVSNER